MIHTGDGRVEPQVRPRRWRDIRYEGDRVLTPLLAIAALGAVALVVSKLVRHFVPEIVVFLALGVLVGPQGPWSVINQDNIESLRLVTVVALGMIIFLLGDRLRFSDVRKHLGQILPLNVAQILLTVVAVYAVTLALGASPRLAFVLAVIAAETGVLTVTATVREERAEGRFTGSLLTSVGVTNVVVAALFGITFPFVLASGSEAAGPVAMWTAFSQVVVASTLIGLAGGWLLTRLGGGVETSGELLLLVIVVLTGVAGLVLVVDGSVVVATLAAGIYATNRAPWVADRLFAAIRILEAPVYLVFFVVAGAGIHLDELRSVGVVGAGYVIARTVGKIGGSIAGGRAAKPAISTRRALHLGVGMLPHAGMAIALVAFVVEQAPLLAEDVSGVVLGSIVLFELAGPLFLRRALRRSGETASEKQTANVASLGDPRTFRRIVLPVGSARVVTPRLPFLFSLVTHLDAEVVVVHVSRPGSVTSREETPAVLQLVQSIAEENNIKCQIRHRISERIASAIAATVREDAADLLIMGEPLRPSVLAPVGWGRTTQRVVQLVDVPVLVYPVDPAHPGDVPAPHVAQEPQPDARQRAEPLGDERAG